MKPLLSGLSLVAFAAGGLHASLATAVGLPPPATETRPGGIFRAGRPRGHDIRLQRDAGRTQADTASLVLRQRIAEPIHFGILGGWTALTQTDNPATAGWKPQGYHAESRWMSTS